MIKNIFIFFLFFVFTNTAYAKQIKITSDKLEVLRTDNISIFSGNVYAYEENLEIWSDKLTVTSSNDERTIKKINALNNVKIFRENLTINGNEAFYDPLKNKLIVIGEVNIMQSGNIILCDKIIVDLENSSSIMKSESSKRVEALIISEDKIR